MIEKISLRKPHVKNKCSFSTYGSRYRVVNLPATDMTGGFVPFHVPVQVMQSGVQPDSIVVLMQSGSNGHCSLSTDGHCLFFYVDDLTLDMPTGVEDWALLNEKVTAYPNPAISTLTLSGVRDGVDLIRIYDASGRLVDDFQRTAVNLTLNVERYPPGVYQAQLIDQQKETSSTIRFLVQ